MNLQGYETDGVPAPSDFELEAADRSKNTRTRNATTFNRFCTLFGVTGDDRPKFNAYVKAEHTGEMTTLSLAYLWADWPDRGHITPSYSPEDARDLADTHQDALR